jgi:DNA-binding ferritin-like protein
VLSERIIGILASHKEVIMEAFRIIQAAVDMSDETLKDIIQALSVELQDREVREDEQIAKDAEDAMSMGLYISEIIHPDKRLEKKMRDKYIELCEEAAGPGETPFFQDILSKWYSEQDRIQSMNTTGA